MRPWIGLVVAGLMTGCSGSVNVSQERDALTQRDREWASTVKDLDKFMSFYTPDASIYPPGMPRVTGPAPIREAFTKMMSAPGFSLEFAPASADVAASGDLAYTTGTYQMSMSGGSEKGKYVTVWKKVDGVWMVSEDIFNADGGGASAPTSHTAVAPDSITFGDGPPSLPPGAKLAVLSGDPSKPMPFVIRAQVPAGYKVPPHWHPTDENLTILSGTVALGMGDAFDESKMQATSAGGLVVLPAQMRHYFLAKTAATFQVHGMGPFEVNYINPADDPRQKK